MADFTNILCAVKLRCFFGYSLEHDSQPGRLTGAPYRGALGPKALKVAPISELDIDLPVNCG